MLGLALRDLPHAQEEEAIQTAAHYARPRQRWLAGSAAVVLLAGACAGVAAERCHFVACQPLTWPELRALARQQAASAGAGYEVEAIMASPIFPTAMTESGPYDIEFTVFVGNSRESTIAPGSYGTKTFEVLDRSRSIRWRDGEGGSSESVPADAADRLQRVQIGPRDAYRITWPEAQREMQVSQILSAHMRFSVNDWEKGLHGADLTWQVSYVDDAIEMTYWVDAETGKIVDSKRATY